MLRWLLLLPGGDRRRRPRGRCCGRGDRGEILHGEADYQIHIVYLWYEKRFTEALALLRDLSRTYPRNPLFAWQIGDVEDVYFHDLSASRDAYASLLAPQRAAVTSTCRILPTRRRGWASRVSSTRFTRPTAPSTC